MDNKLNEKLALEVLSMPEYRQGVNKVRVVLHDGRVFDDVFIAWGREIVKVTGFSEIPFPASDVISVENAL